MAHTVATPVAVRHLSRLESVRPEMVKAHLKNLEADWTVKSGQALAAAIRSAGWTRKEAAAALAGRDEAQIARWISGAEGLSISAVLACDELRHRYVMALAKATGKCRVTETISFESELSA